jgi:hypothetical protein
LGELRISLIRMYDSNCTVQAALTNCNSYARERPQNSYMYGHIGLQFEEVLINGI